MKATLSAAEAGGPPPEACRPTDGRLANFTPVDPVAPPPKAPIATADGTLRGLAEVAAGRDGKGRGAVVNFWATWCSPCIKEMPQLDSLKATLAKDGIDVVAVSEDRGGLAKVKPFFEKQGYKNLAIHLDPKGRLARSLGVRGLPTTLIVDAKGQLLVNVLGAAEWDAPHVVDLIRGCLKD